MRTTRRDLWAGGAMRAAAVLRAVLTGRPGAGRDGAAVSEAGGTRSARDAHGTRSAPVTRGSTWRAAAAAVLALGLTAACTAGTTNQSGGENSGGGTVIYGKTDGGTTFVRNYNVMGPATDKAPHPEMIYEQLLRIDYGNGAAIEPWLAESWEFNEDGTRLTMTLRDDVTFSDGEKFTADDVVYSLSLPLEKPEFSIAGVTYTAVEKVDDTTVEVTFAVPSFATLKQFATVLLPMVPEHIWNAEDLNTWTNPDPIGTGPFTLGDFKPQQVTLQARDDYWGGELPMDTFKIIPTGEALKAQLLRGEVDLGTASWANGEEEYVAEDPERHLYQLYSNGGAMSLLFNTAKPPFDDVHVRRALSMTIDRTAVVTTLQRPGSEAAPTGLSEQLYAEWISPEHLEVQPVAADDALAELAAGGWTVEDGALVKDGQSYPLTILFNADWGWGSYADILINTWRDTLGLEVQPAGQPNAGYYDQQSTGTFDMVAATTGGAGVYGVYNFLSSSFVMPIGESASLNAGRWNDPETDEIITAMERTEDVEELKALGQQLQDIVVDEVPFSPIYNNYWFIDINATRWTNWPTPESFDHIPFIGLGPDLTLTLLDLEPTGES
ncbi:ABC transporter substrate-binding protein [Jiangella muralis]|uniref:ABC transporter substrate-binding protein n=1 Tax=Jiangella muralis TaxID=702383 RepID=UPI000B0F45FA|nr:ABC transporter substrate-binding protein [Jiangella muralis]